MPTLEDLAAAIRANTGAIALELHDGLSVWRPRDTAPCIFVVPSGAGWDVWPIGQRDARVTWCDHPSSVVAEVQSLL